MEDELEDRVFYQTYLSHARLVSRASLGAWASAGAPLAHAWRLTRIYLLRYEVAALSLALVLLLLYMQSSPSPPAAAQRREWSLRAERAAAFALQGRRPRMEDRFAIEERLAGLPGVSLYAVFDGHGGELAADFAKDELVRSLAETVSSVKEFAAGKRADGPASPARKHRLEAPVDVAVAVAPERNKSFEADDLAGRQTVTDSQLLSKLASGPVTRRATRAPDASPVSFGSLSHYVDAHSNLDYGKLLTDEILAADSLLLRKAKKTMDVAGTTALVAVVDGERLFVANVGDSRGVMCDCDGKAVPLSFDHKPQMVSITSFQIKLKLDNSNYKNILKLFQMREQNRIKKAGGFIAFNGVWRVAGILATSRALGDYPLKDKKFVIAEPDVLYFDLADERPSFILLATDGLWDAFSNEEAVDFLQDKLEDLLAGAEELVMQAYLRGSVDNITVLLIDLRDKKYKSSSDAVES